MAQLPSNEEIDMLVKTMVDLLNSPDMGKSEVMQVEMDKRTAETPFAESESFTNPSVEQMFGDDPITESEIELANQAEKEFRDMFEYTRHERERFSTEEEKKVMNDTEVADAFKDEATSEPEDIRSPEIEKLINDILKSDMFSTPTNKEIERTKSEAVKKPKKPESPVSYKKEVAEFNGTEYPFKRAVVTVDWGKDFDASDTLGNLLQLRKLITNDILHYFGDWSRIRSVHVFGEQLIINGVCYTPRIRKSCCDKLPLDTLDYIANGTIASLFDWSKLRKMTNLYELHIDSMQFYVITVCDDLGWHKDACALFKICDSLEVLSIGGEIISIDGCNNKTTARAKRSGMKMQHFRNLFDGYKLNVYAGTEGIQNFMFNNLKTYATNRGNKGLFRYIVGTSVRAGLTVGAGAVNLGAHIIGGIFKTAKSVITSRGGSSDTSDM